MNVVFFCQSCGSRFEVDAVHAGKSARCRKCGQRTTVPKPSELASMTALPVVPDAKPKPKAAPAPAAAVATPPAPAAAKPRPKPTPAALAASASWIAAVNSNVGLAPITESAIPIARRAATGKPTPLDNWDDEDSKPYVLAVPERPVRSTRASKPVSGAKMLWRSELGSLQKILRRINETAYLFSVPFLMLIILGVAFQSRSMALMGALVVVALNIGRFVVGLGNILVIPFRDSPMQGLLFLIPPFTFFYCNQHWNKLSKPVKRVVGPALTIGLVAAAFLFIPSLRGEAGTDGDPAATLKRDVFEAKSRANSMLRGGGDAKPASK